ncbi:39S ribosomal protein L35, mitochondrial [Osmerus eperlanus]|uniref:Large ribosomal subunit protein bL35m n=1 Tax=Osmerus mordax TaxID=8014 RepID=C1BL58_OSMMO|nr:39S ribosomal protein L35, mitochondrial precursor [Osmerus mordax]
MAAALARSVPGLLRPLTLVIKTPQICRFSAVIHRQTVLRCATAAPAGSWVAKTIQSPQPSILQRVSPLIPSLVQPPSRTLTYFSLKKGKRKTVRSVTKRFLRLHCGLWVRRKSGYKKKLWKKMPARKKRLREHVFCNKTQSKLLNKMTTSFWKRRNWYVNDPYEKYHDRVNLKV